MRCEAAYITILLGIAIFICLASLIFFANNAGQSTWKGLTSIVFLLGGVTYSFHRFWSDAQNSVDMLDSQTIAFSIFKLKKEEERQRESK